MASLQSFRGLIFTDSRHHAHFPIMGEVYGVNWPLNSEIYAQKKRLVGKLIVAKWHALATYKGFNNYISC